MIDIFNNIILPLPSIDTIKKNENIWKIKLPSKYIEFISSFNGAIPSDKNNFIEYDNNCYVIDRFLGIIENYSSNPLGIYDIDVVLSQLDCRLTKNPDKIGVDLLPIIALFSGNFICLDYCSSYDSPSICIWFHEDSDEFKPVTITISNSFEDFIEKYFK